MLHGLMVNEDDTHFYYTRHRQGADIPIDEVHDFVDQYVGTQVSELVLCVAGRLATYDSAVIESYVDKYRQRVENGTTVDHRQSAPVAAMYNLVVEQGIDWYAVAFDRARAQGISPWASIRMNDCHDNDQATSFLHPDFFHESPQLRRVRHREPTDYFDRCYDYEQPEIHDRMIRLVEEVAFRYDVDGIELDWMRENFCFQVGREHPGTRTINRFMRDTREVLERAAHRWGHPIKLGARVMADPIQSADNGFNVLDWVHDGSIDVVVPTARWRTTDNDMPIAFWKQILRDHPVTLAAGLDIIVSPSRKPLGGARLQMQTVETTQGAAAHYLSQGADKIYLFNYMDRTDQTDADPSHATYGSDYQQVLTTIGSDQVYDTARRHVVTFPDVGPVFAPLRDRLPVTVAKDRYAMVRVGVGRIDAGAQVQLVLGVCDADGEAVPAGALLVHLNSTSVRQVDTKVLTPPYVSFPCHSYDVDHDGSLPPFVVVEVSTVLDVPLSLEYVEVRVN